MANHNFNGRELTATAIAVAAVGSAALNTWGGFHIFPNPVTGWVIAAVILACEFIAFLTPRHIVKDFEDRHYWKAYGASIILVFAIAGCVFSGKQAFHVLFLEADHVHKTLEIRADSAQALADDYRADILAGNIEAGISVSNANARWERMQTRADAARLEELKAKPPHTAVVYVLLALFEMVKIGGLFFIATEKNQRGMTWKQRRALRHRNKIDAAKAEREFEAKLDNVVNISDAA